MIFPPRVLSWHQGLTWIEQNSVPPVVSSPRGACFQHGPQTGPSLLYSIPLWRCLPSIQRCFFLISVLSCFVSSLRTFELLSKQGRHASHHCRTGSPELRRVSEEKLPRRPSQLDPRVLPQSTAPPPPPQLTALYLLPHRAVQDTFVTELPLGYLREVKAESYFGSSIIPGIISAHRTQCPFWAQPMLVL